MTSAVSAKSTSGFLSCSALSGTAARSSARTSLSEPLTARPIGVRTASTMTASGIDRLLEHAPASHSQGGFPRRRTRRGLPSRIPAPALEPPRGGTSRDGDAWRIESSPRGEADERLGRDRRGLAWRDAGTEAQLRAVHRAVAEALDVALVGVLRRPWAAAPSVREVLDAAQDVAGGQDEEREALGVF